MHIPNTALVSACCERSNKRVWSRTESDTEVILRNLLLLLYPSTAIYISASDNPNLPFTCLIQVHIFTVWNTDRGDLRSVPAPIWTSALRPHEHLSTKVSLLPGMHLCHSFPASQMHQCQTSLSISWYCKYLRKGNLPECIFPPKENQIATGSREGNEISERRRSSGNTCCDYWELLPNTERVHSWLNWGWEFWGFLQFGFSCPVQIPFSATPQMCWIPWLRASHSWWDPFLIPVPLRSCCDAITFWAITPTIRHISAASPSLQCQTSHLTLK